MIITKKTISVLIVMFTVVAIFCLATSPAHAAGKVPGKIKYLGASQYGEEGSIFYCAATSSNATKVEYTCNLFKGSKKAKVEKDGVAYPEADLGSDF